MVDLLGIVQVLQHIQQPLHARRVVARQFDGVFRPHGHARHFGRQACRFQGILHGFKVGGGGQHLYCAVVVGHHVFGPRLQRHFHHLVFAGAGGKNQLAAVLELKNHRALGAHVATVFAERVSYFGHGAHPVVGHRVDHDRCATNAIALVADFLVGQSLGVARGLVDVVLDAVGGHVGRLGLVHRQAQAGVGRQVAAARAGSHSDFTNDAGPDLAAFFILPPFAVLDIRPFAVSCHEKSFCIDLIY